MSPEAFRSRMQVQRQSKPGARLLLDRVRSVRRRPRVGGRRRAYVFLTVFLIFG